MIRTKVLLFCDYFVPGVKAGGPIQSIKNIIKLLEHEIRFDVVTRDRDYEDFEAYNDIVPESWNKVNKINVHYVTKTSIFRHLLAITKLIKNSNHDILYLNSLFSLKYSIIPLFVAFLFRKNLVVILAPRGELMDEALGSKKKRKSIYLFVLSIILLFREIIFHASTEYEARKIDKKFPHKKLKISIAPDIFFLSNEGKNSKNSKNSNSIKIIFLARISEHKNLLFLLEIISLLDSKYEVILDIYGPKVEVDYWIKCEKVIGNIHKKNRYTTVSYKGILQHDEVNNTLKKYHLFILPSKSENFGHSIVEALFSGCPAIISDNTPWLNLAQYKAGFDLPLYNIDLYLSAIETFIKMNQDEYKEWSEGAYSYIKDKLNLEDIHNSNLELFSLRNIKPYNDDYSHS